MRIRVRRVGGIAGNIALAAELDTAQLPASDATRLEGALEALPWGAPAGVPPHPDAFRYEVDLPDEPGRGTAVLEESDVGGDMDLLRTHLQSDGVIESRRRPG
ncbi:protealysin inhibitor emfourin [Blastococcus sp. CT_GayMR16]|uniref:protealysin inhibitor emfourin n=1 Tax=Blastococcus sp. CT_GayMR16 TaxID=2559607 RepID=UPI001073F2D5|nr:protealysin inhibitor emfourin [Blastococcus sp. CT_GayMR16]TFV89121.1 hypothetical protein E4P38_08205 [Blastococcus sp. CT_GayMR16]